MPKRNLKFGAAVDVTITFKDMTNTKETGADVEATVKPPNNNVESALRAAGFTPVTQSVVFNFMGNLAQAKAAFLVEAAKHGLAVEQESDHVLVVNQGVPVKAGAILLMAANDWDVVPVKDTEDFDGYMTIEGLEDPGDEPHMMSIGDWAIYRSNYLAAQKELPEGGEEGKASNEAEYPGTKYPGDVVYEDGQIWVYRGAESAMAKLGKCPRPWPTTRPWMTG